MAVQPIEKNSSKPMEYICLSTDTKPTDVPVGAGLTEVVNGVPTNFYIFDGTNWLKF